MLLKKGSQGREVGKLQKGLKALGMEIFVVDNDFGPGTERAVEEFQHNHDLYDDGVVGNVTAQAIDATLQALDDPAALQFLLLGTPPVEDQFEEYPPHMMEWRRCPADIFPGRDGYDHLALREDVANAYIDLYNAVHELGGIITTAGGKRLLSEASNASRSKTSFHYTGRAFDLALPTGMQDPSVDPFVIEKAIESDRHWVVWCRSNKSLLSLSNKVSSGFQIPVTDYAQARKMSGTKIKGADVKGVFFNFTALAKLFGFERIRARSSFFLKGVYTSAEWWHFQYVAGLAPNISTFGRELLKVYTPQEAEKFVYWKDVKDLKYGKDWG